MSQHVCAHFADRIDARHVGRLQERDLLTFVPGGNQLALQGRHVVGTAQHRHARVVGHRHTAGEQSGLRVIGGVGADDGLHELLLVHGLQRHATDGRVVEWREHLVEAQETDQALSLHDLDFDGPVGAQLGDKVHQGLLDEIDFVIRKGRDLGGRVGGGEPLDAVEMGDFRAGRKARCILARHIAFEPGIDVAGARYALVSHVAERAAADHLD